MRIQTTLMLVVVAGRGCSPPEPTRTLPGVPTPVGDHLRFYAGQDADSICAGTLDYIDRYVGELKIMHGTDPAARVDYFWLSSDTSAELCSRTSACTFEDGVVVTPWLPHEHELVHAVRAHTAGSSHPFFEEGLAELWGNASDRTSNPIGDAFVGIEQGSLGALSTAWYPTAGRFAAYLQRRFGTVAVIRFAGSLDSNADVTAVQAEFMRVFGMDLEVALSDFDSEGWTCNRSWYRDDVPNCNAARRVDCSAVDAEGGLTVTLDANCHSEESLGPRDGISWSEAIITVPSTRFVRSTSTGPQPSAMSASLTVRRCTGGCSDQPASLPAVPLGDHEWYLEGGDYLLRLEMPTDGASEAPTSIRFANVCDG